MAPRQRIRLRLTRGSASTESTPRGYNDIEDEPMPDADTGANASDHEEKQTKDEDEDDGDGDAKPEDSSDDGEAPGKDDDDDGDDLSEASVKEPTPPPQPVIRRKRLGRPPKNRPPDWDNMVTVSEKDADTPRRRGRGGWRGRGGRKGGPAAPKAEQVIDAEGTVAEIVDDECVLPEDDEGETKVDKMGNLQDGRDYRCRTFKVLGRGNRLYMLSTEPARCVGFRDSYLFFTKHRKLYKIIVDDDEKRDMIEREIIPHSYKGRSIGIVTARSVFREFGARIIVGGKRIADDYAVTQARADGVAEGQLADPDDHFIPGEPYNKNQYVAWHGASAVYHTNVPSVPVPSGKIESKKRKVNVNDTNWMLEHAREASTFNAGINAIRKFNNEGVYDIHTNVMQYPANMQPTLARIEQVTPEEEEATKGSTVFPPVPQKLARNFFVADTYLETPEAGGAPAAAYRSDPADFLASFNGLGAVSNELKDLLPPECRDAFDTALQKENNWRSRWGPETTHMSRREPTIDKAIVPFSMSG
ncbi:Chromatin structure-remodeling complex subunit rsc7 [Cladobotryum mycophilum]|uniref:Chromatin structure-remodeling complex subunit rsc7 n=1 Tax=Cladobotryum mycophilum TaxID=491253 RepID=A0ABR0S596_9HYPO